MATDRRALELRLEAQRRGLSAPSPAQPVDQPKGFIERVGERFEERQLEVTDTFEDLSTGKIGPLQAGLQTLGKAAGGGTLDVLGEGLVSGIRGLSAITPDAIEDPVVSGVKNAFNSIVNTDAGKAGLRAINEGSDAWRVFKQKNPQGAKSVESMANLLLLGAPVRTKVNAPPSPLVRGADALESAAKKREALSRKSFVEDIVTPKETPTVLTEQVPRTFEVGRGPFKRSVVKLSPAEKEIAAEVGKLGSVSSKKTLQGNYNAIAAVNTRLASRLESKLAKEKTVANLDDVTGRITTAIEDVVTRNPTVVGDRALAAKANRVGQKALELINDQPLTPLGLLKARRELDSWLLKNRPKVFDQAENTLSASGRAVRNVLNNTINELAPNSAVKTSLRRQSNLFRAMENIAPKASSEANTAIMRAWQNAARILPIRNRAIQDAAVLFGVGGLGAAAMFAPTLTKAGATIAIGYGANKAIMHPSTFRGISSLLKGIDKAIKTGKNPSTLKQLRLDRAAIVELLEQAEIDDTFPQGFQEPQETPGL